jgi:transcription initiation factor TFIIIB Brf1 subunit/transcription initiation factor TFIIB
MSAISAFESAVPVPADPDVCPSCNGRVTVSPAGTERSCVGCGIVYDDSPLVVIPEARGDGAFGSEIRAPHDRHSTLGRDPGKVASILRWTERNSGSRSPSSHRDRLAARRYFAGKDAAERLGLSPATQREVGTLVSRTGARGRSYEDLGAAAAILVSRRYGVPLSIKEVCRKLDLDRTALGRALRFIQRENPSARAPAVPLPKVVLSLLERLPTPAPGDCRRWLISSAETLEGQTVRATPTVLAAALLDAVSQVRRELLWTQQSIASAAFVTEISVRTSRRMLLGFDLPPVPPSPKPVVESVLEEPFVDPHPPRAPRGSLPPG